MKFNTAVNGALKLTWHKGQAVPHTDVSGQLAFGHGYFEANLQFDNVPGAWPAFWLLPIEGKVNPGIAQAGELDVLEWMSSTPNECFTNIHLWAPGGVQIITLTNDRSRKYTLTLKEIYPECVN